MSTRSYIGQLQPNGTVRAIYCHSDGYPEHVGAVLAGHHATAARVAALLDLGDLSQLHPATCPPPGVAHSFGAVAPGVCVAYGRDRGDSDTAAVEYADVATFYSDAIGEDGPAEWAYLFAPVSGWWVCGRDKPGQHAPLCLLLASLPTT